MPGSQAALSAPVRDSQQMIELAMMTCMVVQISMRMALRTTSTSSSSALKCGQVLQRLNTGTHTPCAIAAHHSPVVLQLYLPVVPTQ